MSESPIPVGLISSLPAEGTFVPDTALFTVDSDAGCLSFDREELDDGVKSPLRAMVEGRLGNSEYLAELPLHLVHLSDLEKVDIIGLIHSFPSLFLNVPIRTSVAEHDIVACETACVSCHS